MENNLDYGKLNKKIVFTENDHRHAQLIIRLKHDNLKQSEFFRAMITGYLNNDERILNYIDEIKNQSIKKTSKSKKLRQKGEQLLSDSGLSNDQISDLFDMIAEEHPDL
jgi:translation elongation factor EF-G